MSDTLLVILLLVVGLFLGYATGNALIYWLFLITGLFASTLVIKWELRHSVLNRSLVIGLCGSICILVLDSWYLKYYLERAPYGAVFLCGISTVFSTLRLMRNPHPDIKPFLRMDDELKPSTLMLSFISTFILHLLVLSFFIHYTSAVLGAA